MSIPFAPVVIRRVISARLGESSAGIGSSNAVQRSNACAEEGVNTVRRSKCLGGERRLSV